MIDSVADFFDQLTTEAPECPDRDVATFKSDLESKSPDDCLPCLWYTFYPVGGIEFGNPRTNKYYMSDEKSVELVIIGSDGDIGPPDFYGQLDDDYVSSFDGGSIRRPKVFYNYSSKVYKVNFLDKDGVSVAEVLIHTKPDGSYECTTSGCIHILEPYVEYDIN
jgi:hypothetical protein